MKNFGNKTQAHAGFGMPFAITCTLLLGMALVTAATPTEAIQVFAVEDIPIINLKGQKSDILNYKYLGSWSLKLKSDWRNTWKDFIKIDTVNESRAVKLTRFANPLPGALPKLLTPDTESAYFKTISWQDNQVSAFAFCGVSAKTQTAILELDTDTRIAIYNNAELIKEVQPVETIESGALLYVSVPLEKGNNIFVIKILSNSHPPRIRAAMVLDHTRDFQAAWSASWGFLSKNIYPSGKTMEAPALKWDASLDRLTVSAKVRDCLTGEIVTQKDRLKNGSVIRNGPDYLQEGLYEISYNDNRSGASEHFIVGSPRIVFEKLKESLPDQSLIENEKINIEAQIRRGNVLLDRKNYDADNPEWQEKVVYTLASLAGFVGMMKDGVKSLSKNIPGLHIRGFVSQIDHSTQFYRIFVPSTYTPERSIPLLLIMPTPVTAKSKPFIESPFMASHRQAVQISTYAEKHGFAVAWPGYRNPPDGWSYESAHADEVIKAVERDYNIDKIRTSVYGSCGGGFFAGRLVSKYPKRFAAIVYDRAYFDRDVEAITNAPDSLKYWHHAIAPAKEIVKNTSIKILVLNDGSRAEGHGELKVSEEFLETALRTRPDIKYALGQRSIGIELWNVIFDYLSTCQNNNASEAQSNDLGRYGYAGPISEIFATPFIVVEGTSTGPEGLGCIRAAVEEFKAMYARQFFGVCPVVKKDADITDDDIKTHSLVLIGNTESNTIWSRLNVELPVKFTSDGLSMGSQSYPAASAFASISRNPLNDKNYIFMIGAKDLKHLALTKSINPSKAWFDCCVIEPHGKFHRQRIINTLLKTNQSDKTHEAHDP